MTFWLGKYRRPALLAVVVASSLPSEAAHAGWLASFGLGYDVVSFEPEKDEPTPNYYGYGARLALGYSLGGVLDLAAFGRYLPVSRSVARFGRSDATIGDYGGELALRMGGAIYLALRAGSLSYRWSGADPGEHDLTATRRGTSYGLALGAYYPLADAHALQVSLDASQASTRGTGETTKRAIDTVALGVTYVFNSSDKFSLDDSILNQFLDSLIF